MKTPTNPELAAFIAGLLKMEPCNSDGFMGYYEMEKGHTIAVATEDVFNPQDKHSEMISAFIRHLIEEEMERRDYWWKSEKREDGSGYEYDLFKDWEDVEEDNKATDKNKTRAVALAAYRTGER